MKNTILTVIIGASLIATTVSAYALYTVKPLDGFTKITNSLIDNDAVTVYKFTDGNVTCYGSYVRSTSASISCMNNTPTNAVFTIPTAKK